MFDHEKVAEGSFEETEALLQQLEELANALTSRINALEELYTETFSREEVPGRHANVGNTKATKVLSLMHVVRGLFLKVCMLKVYSHVLE